MIIYIIVYCIYVCIIGISLPKFMRGAFVDWTKGPMQVNNIVYPFSFFPHRIDSYVSQTFYSIGFSNAILRKRGKLKHLQARPVVLYDWGGKKIHQT